VILEEEREQPFLIYCWRKFWIEEVSNVGNY